MAAARILATLPPDLMELLEPDASLPSLQAMCRRLVLPSSSSANSARIRTPIN